MATILLACSSSKNSGAPLLCAFTLDCTKLNVVTLHSRQIKRWKTFAVVGQLTAMRHFITLRLDNGFCIIYNAASVAISPTRLGASPRRAVYAFYDDCLRDTARYCAVRISSARSD